jgi:hypothetical protein
VIYFRENDGAQPLQPFSCNCNESWGAPYPGFPAEFVGVDALDAAFLNESRTRGRGLVPRTGNPGQAAFWLEWDATAAPLLLLLRLHRARIQTLERLSLLIR